MIRDATSEVVRRKGRVCDFPVEWLLARVGDDGRGNRAEAFLPGRPSRCEDEGLVMIVVSDGESDATYPMGARRGGGGRRGDRELLGTARAISPFFGINEAYLRGFT